MLTSFRIFVNALSIKLQTLIHYYTMREIILKIVSFFQKKTRNIVEAVYCKAGIEGVRDLIRRISVVSSEDMLAILKLGKRLPGSSVKMAAEAFITTVKSLQHLSVADQAILVEAVGFERMYQMYLSATDRACAEAQQAVQKLYDAFAPEKRHQLVSGLFLFYRDKVFQKYEKSPVMEYLAEQLNADHAYCRHDLLTAFLVDNYCLPRALDWPDNFQAIAADIFSVWAEFASEEGIRNCCGLMARRSCEYRALIQKFLFVGQSTKLQVALQEMGRCDDADVERYLLENNASFMQTLSCPCCHPQNFELAVQKLGLGYVVENFPVPLKEMLLVKNICRNKLKDNEWAYILLDRQSLNIYLKNGGKLTKSDLAFLLKNGRDDTLRRYWAKQA